jgi:hypothetical protein
MKPSRDLDDDATLSQLHAPLPEQPRLTGVSRVLPLPPSVCWLYLQAGLLSYLVNRLWRCKVICYIVYHSRPRTKIKSLGHLRMLEGSIG